MIIKIKKPNMAKIIEYLYLFLLGVVAFSRMSQYIVLDVLNLPFYLIEIFFIPFFMYSYKEYFGYFQNASKKKSFLFFVLVILWNLLIGFAYTFDLVGIVSTTRALAYIILIALIFKEKKGFSIDKLFLISVGATIGELLYAVNITSTDIASINTSCLALMVLIPIIKKRYITFLLCSILGLIVSINSGYRIGIVVLLVSIAIGVVWITFSKEKLTLKTFLGKLSIPIAMTVFVAICVSYYEKLVAIVSGLFGTSEYAIYRVTNRLVGLFTGNISLSRDQQRLENYSLILETFVERLLPRGLVGESVGVLGQYFDVPIIYMYDAFGSVLTIVLLAIICYKGLMCFLQAFKKETPDYLVLSGLMFPIFIIFIITNGSFLYITFQCITTGIILGEWFSIENTRKMTSSLNRVHKIGKIV